MADSGMDHIKVETSVLAPGVHELRIDGSLDWSNFAKVETAIESIFAKNVFKIVVNLKNCKYISSAGFGCFISSLDTAMKNNGDLVFASTPAEIQDVFNILGLSKILRFAEDARSALAQFKK
ncbi:MAG TPA: STAS domain-containing protein [Planctomycetota bacterium]|nr:STAS domain-containing protein [Planctomycetota bacterium]